MNEHLDPDQLNAFAEGVLPAHEREQALAHLAICPHCREIVHLALPPYEEPAAPVREAALVRKWFSGWRLAWAAGASFAGLALFSLMVTGRKPAFPPVIEQMARSAPPQPLRVPAAAPMAAPAVVAQKPRVVAPNAPLSQNLDQLRARPVAPEQSQAVAVASDSVTEAAAAPVARAAAAPAMKAAALAPPASATTVEASNASAAIETTNATSFAAVIDTQSINALPAETMRSSYTQGKQTLAIDAAGRLFRSTDGGRHYKPVKAVWSGRAVRIAAPGDERVTTPVTVSRNATPGPAGTLAGDITDVTGASLPGAIVAVSIAGSAPVQTVKADGNGHFQTRPLPPGKYQIDTTFTGFQTLRTEVQVAQAETPPLQLRLQLGSASETVNVSAAIPESSTRIRKVQAPLFELTIDTGEHWTSVDGKHWKPAQK